MQRLAWPEEHGAVSWNQADGRWLGAWERQKERDGLFASARGSMVSFLLDGAMSVDRGGSSVLLRPGDALIIRGTPPFRYHMEPRTRLFVTEVAAPPTPIVEIAHIRATEVPRGAAQALASAREDSRGSLLRVAEVADALYQRAGQPIPPPPAQSALLMLRVKAHLDTHFRDPDLRMQQVAKRFGVDSFYLARQFARVLGMTPKAYLQWLRFEHFLRSLLCQPRSVIELALEAGFSDYATFSRRVRRQLGLPPSALVTPSASMTEAKINFAHAQAGALDHAAAHEPLMVRARSRPRGAGRVPCVQR